MSDILKSVAREFKPGNIVNRRLNRSKLNAAAMAGDSKEANFRAGLATNTDALETVSKVETAEAKGQPLADGFSKTEQSDGSVVYQADQNIVVKKPSGRIATPEGVKAKVEFVDSVLKGMDGNEALDKNDADGAVEVDGTAKKLSRLGRVFASGDNLENLSTAAPKGKIEPEIKGSRTDSDMQVEIKYDEDKSVSFSKKKRAGKTEYRAGSTAFIENEDGSFAVGGFKDQAPVIHRSGNEVVIQNADGTLFLHTNGIGPSEGEMAPMNVIGLDREVDPSDPQLIGRSNRPMHDKMVVVDGKVLHTNGIGPSEGEMAPMNVIGLDREVDPSDPQLIGRSNRPMHEKMMVVDLPDSQMIGRSGRQGARGDKYFVTEFDSNGPAKLEVADDSDYDPNRKVDYYNDFRTGLLTS